MGKPEFYHQTSQWLGEILILFLLSPHLIASKVWLLGRNYLDFSFVILGFKSEVAPWSHITRMVVTSKKILKN